VGYIQSLRRRSGGFTLVELLVVIAIIGVLATLVLLQLGTARGRARDTKRITDVNQIRSAVEQYFEDNNGEYPPGITDADIGNYMTRVPTDPLTDDPYQYDTDPTFQAFQIVAELENSAAALDNDADLVPGDLNGGGVDASETNETCASKTVVDCQYDQGIRL
jgi:prepilin-type N-terminal cleavage/methylation domain-containing protein